MKGGIYRNKRNESLVRVTLQSPRVRLRRGDEFALSELKVEPASYYELQMRQKVAVTTQGLLGCGRFAFVESVQFRLSENDGGRAAQHGSYPFPQPEEHVEGWSDCQRALNEALHSDFHPGSACDFLGFKVRNVQVAGRLRCVGACRVGEHFVALKSARAVSTCSELARAETG